MIGVWNWSHRGFDSFCVILVPGILQCFCCSGLAMDALDVATRFWMYCVLQATVFGLVFLPWLSTTFISCWWRSGCIMWFKLLTIAVVCLVVMIRFGVAHLIFHMNPNRGTSANYKSKSVIWRRDICTTLFTRSAKEHTVFSPGSDLQSREIAVNMVANVAKD